MTRRLCVLAALAVTMLFVGSCHDWNRAPFAASLQPAFGARVTDGKLQIWTGSRCVGITRLALRFEPSRAELVLTTPSDEGMEFDRIPLDGPYPTGAVVAEPLPDHFAWRQQESLRISLHGGPGGWGTVTNLTEVIDGSDQHPTDTYWFQDVGWLNPADVAAQDGKTFLATCTDDPAKNTDRTHGQ